MPRPTLAPRTAAMTCYDSAMSHASFPRAHAVLAALVTVALGPVALGGCSASSSFPSLAVRPAERVSGTATPDAAASPEAVPAAPVAASASLSSRLATLLANARAADRTFTADRAVAERAIAGAGADYASKSRAAAEVAYSKLVTGRSGTLAALAELDGLYADARNAQPVGDTPDLAAISSARAEVQGMAERQDSTLDALGAQLRG